jgi:long-chain acyl-CoA synthetase
VTKPRRREPVPKELPALPGRAVARLAKRVELALGFAELSLPQYRVLALLAASSALASRLAVSPPSITALVDGLVARELVERRPDPSDRRRIALVLTDKGRRVLTDADAAVGERLDDIAAYLEPDERRQALDGLHLWHQALDAYRDARVREA